MCSFSLDRSPDKTLSPILDAGSNVTVDTRGVNRSSEIFDTI